jgi:ABC-2 type transport system permease protein
MRHSLRRVRSLVLVLGLLLAAFQVLLTLVAKSFHRSDSFSALSTLVPDFMRQLMGPSIIAVMSFGGVVCVGYFHVAVMGSLLGLVIALGTEPAAEIENGFMDLILSRPVARRSVITRSVGVAMVSVALVLLMVISGTWIGLYALAPEGAAWPSASVVWSLGANLGALLLCWAGITMGVSSFCRRRSVAGAISGIAALATFLLDYLARAWQPAESIAWLSPFRYYGALDLILGQPLPLHHLWILLGVAAAGVITAYVAFSRRDI